MDWPEEEDLELLDIKEQAELVGKLTPIEFARINGIAPQQVFGWIRKGILETERCICGRKVLDVATAQEVVDKRRRRSYVDADPDPPSDE
jgi:uncharacterized membrane protein YkoI